MRDTVQTEAVREPLLVVDDLRVNFEMGETSVYAVRGLSFSMNRGEVVAVIGESGSGKSVTIKTILGTLQMPPGRLLSGSVRFDGEELLTMAPRARRSLQGDRIAMVFQDALAALNPVYTIGWQIAEIFHVHRGMPMSAGMRAAGELLQLVGIPNATQRVNEYAHQFSGGMRQRVMIAMSIALRPQLLLADEPTTALDVTVQAQIMQLLARLSAETELAMLLVTHNIAIAAEVADRFLVMYAGSIVEMGSADKIIAAPAHPYTKALVDLATREDVIDPIPGAPPDLRKAIDGCAFEPRCPFATEICRRVDPELRHVQVRQSVACHHSERLAKESAWTG